MRHMTERPWVPVIALCVAAAVISTAACNKPSTSAGIDLAGMDKTVAPGDDFNAYTNGGWIKATPIPADKSSYGIFAILADETRKRLLDLFQESAKGDSGSSKGSAPTDADARKIGDYYASYMDEGAIESKGLEPLKPQLNAIAAIGDRHALAAYLGSRLRADVDPLNDTNFETSNLFGVWFAQELTDPSRNVPYLLQGGLGLPDRDYYLSSTPHMAEIRKQYQAHIAAMFKLANASDPAGRAARVFALEMKMAQVHATRVESEDVHSAVVWKREELATKAPGLDWTALLQAAGLQDAPLITIWHPKAIPGLSALAAKEPLDTWKDWLTFHAIDDDAGVLPKAFADERFNFFGKTLSGIPEQRPRWQRAMDSTSGALGEAVGKVYVGKYFRLRRKCRRKPWSATWSRRSRNGLTH